MERYEIQKRYNSDLTINNHKHAQRNIVKCFSSVKLDIFAKSPDIACNVIFYFVSLLVLLVLNFCLLNLSLG